MLDFDMALSKMKIELGNGNISMSKDHFKRHQIPAQHQILNREGVS